VPVITTTAAAVGGFVSESVTYLDVGLKLEVEPLIYLDDEVGIKVGLEVSNIVPDQIYGKLSALIADDIDRVIRQAEGDNQ